MEEIENIFRLLGIHRRYRGYQAALLAIELALQDEDRLLAVTREVYVEVGRQTGTSWTSVERNIRTVVARAWRCNEALLSEMAGYPLASAPTVSEFLDIVSAYLRRKRDALRT